MIKQRAQARTRQRRLEDDVPQLIGFYLDARDRVIAAGFAHEFDHFFHPPACDVRHALAESAWVILSAGMSVRVVSRIFPRVSAAFYNWTQVERICTDAASVRRRALQVFGHRGKINAIIVFARWVAKHGLSALLGRLESEGPQFLQEFPYLGPAASLHLAKNLGADVAKPDRHLVRLADQWGFSSAADLCQLIAIEVGDPQRVVDTVLWRHCVLAKAA